MTLPDALEEYKKALRAGQKEYRECIASGLSPHPGVLDDLLPDSSATQQSSVGLVDIPVELISGTKTAGRQFSFSPSFLPLLDSGTEFSHKWLRLCQAHMGDEGIRDPALCFEYYGNFYVQEGNKRVSVLRFYGATYIPSYVTRIMPVDDGSEKYALYQEFLEFYRYVPLYEVRFTQRGFYRKLLTILGCTDRPLSKDDVQHFNAIYSRFRGCLRGQLALGDMTAGDALIMFLRYHDLEDLSSMEEGALRTSIAALQSDLYTLAQPNPVSVSTEPADPAKETILDKLLFPRRAKHLRIAFVHERDAESSTWTQAHELGRQHLDALFCDQVDTQAYFHVVPGEPAEQLMEQIIENGVDVIFTTTPSMIGSTLRISARHPEIRMLNCSVDMPYPDIRTYYGQIYEGKFITGAIAGAIAKDNRIGYVGSNPIYGVPASINAFALGAQMTNPNVEIELQWSCLRNDYLESFRRHGITVISNRDIPTPNSPSLEYGTFQLLEDGSYVRLASPVWYWGRLYENIVRSLLDGSWATEKEEAGSRAVNYWWGMSSGVIDVVLSEALPAGVTVLAQTLRRELQSGQLDPFFRPIVSQDGVVRNDGSHIFSVDEILHMDWLCSCIDGRIPEFDELLPMARNMARLQGVYRDKLPPEQEDLP